jgi:putative two-component system response regulator
MDEKGVLVRPEQASPGLMHSLAQRMDFAAGAPPNPGGAAPTILIVDSQEINRRMLRGFLKTASYQIRECRKALEAMEILQTERIDLIVLDLMLPEVSGPELCRWLKSNRQTQFIPVLMMTSVQGVENEIEGISSGADEFLLKPVPPAVIRTRVRAMLRNKALTDSLEEAGTILFALAQAVEARDKGTSMHCERLAAYSYLVGERLGLPAPDLLALHRGGYLHDIGKICVPDAILFKEGKLTDEEWVIMRQHTTQGEQICKAMRSLAPVLPIIRSHHERWDGTGYPDGLRGENIPLLARILQVVDIFDALTTARSYKPAFTQAKAFAIMREEVDRGWRERRLIEIFIELMRERPENFQDTMLESLQNMQTNLAR